MCKIPGRPLASGYRLVIVIGKADGKDYSVSDKTLEQFRCTVALVGAGPGDPGLLTLRGRELLELADVVIADRLACQKLRVYAQKATWIDAGKTASHHTLTQEQINAAIIDFARQGKRVVRLKGGDPFIFGRGGEECQALARAKIAFEVVPGITAAIAAATYAGIPATHRDFSSSLTLVTGHERDDGEASQTIDWAAMAKMPCVAFYMGVKSLPTICLNLIENGLPPDTPAACVQWGTTAQQKIVVATVSTLADKAAAEGVGPPAITIVGKNVLLRESIRWFDNRPLSSKTIVITRTRLQASGLSRQLAELGANVIEAPTIEIVPPENWIEVDAALTTPHADWLLFTSANAVEITRRRLFELGLDARQLAGLKIGVIGEATRLAVEQNLCCRVDLCPEQYFAEALTDALKSQNEIAGKRFLMFRADIARPVLGERLREGGAAEVRDIAIHETRQPDSLPAEMLAALQDGRIDWITFTSSSTARNLVAMLGEAEKSAIRSIKTASIGPITSQTMRELAMIPTVEAMPHNIDGLVNAIVQHERSGK